MIMAIDVHYRNTTGVAAGVLFREWNTPIPESEYTCAVENVANYESGMFYKRELPCILALIEKHDLLVDCIVVDGFVYLDHACSPGLGKHLFDALGGTVLVIGVAKTPFPGISDQNKILRGASKKPLYITTTGELDAARQNIVSMHGDFRLPTLLKRVDTICRA